MSIREDVLAEWLETLDKAPLECDGLSRSLSTLLQRDGVEHMVFTGALVVAGVGKIAPHWWVMLPDGRICDIRARMWLGPDERVPHGIFSPAEGLIYHVEHEREPHRIRMSPFIFQMLTKMDMADFSPVLEP